MKSTLRNMILSLGGISLGVAALLGAVHSLTETPIAEASARAAREAVAAVLPPFDNNPMADPAEAGGCEIYPATMAGKPVGAAVRVTSREGFSGDIEIMAGFDTAGTLTGYTVLSQAETPGLGAKADEWFRTAPHSVIGSSGPLRVTKDGGEVDAITAATITSRAFTGALNTARAAYDSYRGHNTDTPDGTTSASKQHREQ